MTFPVKLKKFFFLYFLPLSSSKLDYIAFKLKNVAGELNSKEFLKIWKFSQNIYK